MRKRRAVFLKLIEWIIFAVLAASCVLGVNKLFLPKYTYQNSPWPTTSTYNEFYKMKKNSVDVLFFGSSSVVNAWCPQELYNDYGIRSYNLGSEQQSIFLSYYWLKEALRYQNPDTVVLDLRFLSTLHEDNALNMTEGLIRKCIDPMRWSSVKAEAVLDIVKQDRAFSESRSQEEASDTASQSLMSFYLTNIRYHSRWSSGLSDIDSERSLYANAPLRGWSTMLYTPDDKSSFTPYVRGGSEERAEVNSLQKEYLYKFGELCSESGIRLILVNLPGNGISGDKMTDKFDNTCADIAEDLGADYYNFAEKSLYEELDIDDSKEAVKDHANYWGSVKLSKYIGKLLSEQYGIGGHTDEQYEKTKDAYSQVGKDVNLQFIDDFSDYLEAVNDRNYTLFFSIRDEGTAGLTDGQIQKLQDLGIRTDLKKCFRRGWAAVIDPEKGVSESVSDSSAANLSGTLKGRGNSYDITSAGYLSGASASSIVIGGREYSQDERGINIVVWDNVGRTVIDSVTFDTYSDAQASRSWFADMRKNGIDPTSNTRW